MLLHPLNTVFQEWMRAARYRWRKRKLAGRTGLCGSRSSMKLFLRGFRKKTSHPPSAGKRFSSGAKAHLFLAALRRG